MVKILNSKFYILFIILIIASFLRLYNITELPPGFYPDEAIYANNGVEAWETAPPAGGLKIFYLENNGREGLWPNIIGFFIIKFGHEPWVPRSIAAIFGILTVLGLYFLTKELFYQQAPNSKHQIPNNNQISNDQNSKTSRSLKFRILNLFRIWDLGFGISRSDTIALLSSFFIATSFWHILFSRIGFRAIMAPFFLVWGIYFLLKSLNSILRTSDVLRTSDIQKLAPVQLTGQRAIFFSVLGGIFYGLGFHTYIAYRATPILILIILLLYWFKNKEKEIRKKLLLSTFYFLLSTFIVAAPLGLYFLQNPQDFFGRTTQISVLSSPTPIKDLATNILKTAGMFNFSGDWNWRHNYAGKPLLFWPVGILFIIGVIYGLFQIISTNINKYLRVFDNFGFLILFAWLIITALPVVVSNEGIPHALRAIIMIPPIFILAGFGGVWIYEKLTYNLRPTTYDKKYKLLSVVGCLLLVMLIFEVCNTYFIKWGKNPNVQGAFSADYVQIGRELNSMPKETPKYVIIETGGIDVRGIPMPAQTVMFITDTFTPEKQKAKNIYYVLPEQKNQIPENGYKIILK